MMVVEVWMWPRGDRSKRRFLGAGAFDCQGVASHDDHERGVRKGERWYRVRLTKMPRFGGPGPEELEQALRSGLKKHLWKTELVRGHMPGQRGTWDLIGGALKLMLGRRLQPYREVGR